MCKPRCFHLYPPSLTHLYSGIFLGQSAVWHWYRCVTHLYEAALLVWLTHLYSDRCLWGGSLWYRCVSRGRSLHICINQKQKITKGYLAISVWFLHLLRLVFGLHIYIRAFGGVSWIQMCKPQQGGRLGGNAGVSCRASEYKCVNREICRSICLRFTHSSSEEVIVRLPSWIQTCKPSNRMMVVYTSVFRRFYWNLFLTL